MTKSLDDTIAAIATPPGQGGIAIVRVSGPASLAVAESLLKSTDGALARLEPRRATLCVASTRAGERIDEVIAIFMPAPGSYTCEDVLEIQTHGGRIAGNLVLGEALTCGARLAEAGEFTLRAFLKGRIDLVQAEAVADVIGAVSTEAHRVHESLLGGALTREVAAWQEQLGWLLAHLETDLDFPEDDLEPADHSRIADGIDAVLREMDAKLDSFAWGRVAREGFRVAIVGAPNVGKSSLLNRLAGEERAIVSPRPGTTRDTIEIAVNACGAPVCIVDTAGLRAAGDEIEGEGVERAKRAAADADLLLLVTDASRPPDSCETEELRALVACAPDVLLVANKCDLAAKGSDLGLGGIPPVCVSAKTGEGIDSLLGAIRDRALSGAGRGGEGVLTRERHRAFVREARDDLASAAALLREGGATDVAAASLHSARQALRGLLGWGAPEDVLDRIFAEFCIGK